MLRVIRVLFWIAVATTCYFAWSPNPPQMLANDKSQHELAFAVLTVGATLSWPEARWWAVGAALAGFGGLVEIVQLLPAIHRDSDINDWYADSAAIALALLAAHLLLMLRRRVTERSLAASGDGA